jgi:hypothetical protein
LKASCLKPRWITGAATEPAETTAPEVTEEVHDDALPGTNMDVVVLSLEI